MRKFVTATILVLTLTSCAALDAIDILKPAKPSIGVSAQVGKTNEMEKSNIKAESGKTEIRQDAEEISNDTSYSAETIKQITQNVPIEYLLIVVLLAGWAIPSPKESYQGGKRIVSDIWQGLIVDPVKGVGGFILKVFNRGQ